MTVHLTVEWTVSTAAAPRPWLHCRACGQVRPFAFAGKARLNANGRRLDGWLIYRCATCDGTWNRPVLERRRPEEVDPALLEALRRNAAGPLARLAADLDGLRRHARRIETDGAAGIVRRVVRAHPAEAAALVLHLKPEDPAGCRIDRLLAAGLCLGRARVAALSVAGRLRLSPETALNRALKAPLRVDLALADEPDAGAILRAAGLP